MGNSFTELRVSNQRCLEAVVEATAEFLNKAVKPLRVNVLFKHIQQMIAGDTTVIAETGDSWFNCQKLKLPEGCGYEFQMQYGIYGSIGWSVGGTLGYAQAAKDKRVIAFIGDGSFRVTAQDVSTMLRCEQDIIIFLINNEGYTIEVKIHDGPYNMIKNWNYLTLIEQSTTEMANAGPPRCSARKTLRRRLLPNPQ